jgi:hypothetical protein
MPDSQSFTIAKPRMHHKRRSAAPPSTATLVLVQAIYPVEGVGGAIDLVFDREISIEGLDGTQIIVKDGVITGMINNVAFGERQDAQTVRLFLQGLEDYSVPNQLLDATGDSGIVAVDDGGTWAGVVELGLPWP